GAGVRIEFEEEALPFSGDGRWFDDAAAEDDHFAAFGVEFRRRAGDVGPPDERAGEEESEQATGGGQSAGVAVESHDAERKKGGNGGEQLELRKRYETGNQDARGDGSQGTQKRVLQL